MSEDLREALAELVADTRALLEDAKTRGAVALPPDPPQAPAAPPPSEKTPVIEVKPGDPTRWAALAEAARSAPLPPAEVLRKIREELGACRRCSLSLGRQSVVFGAGDPQADLLVLGLAPQRVDDRAGEPFRGPAGEMLDKMLQNVLGLHRSEAYLCQVVMCHPAGDQPPPLESLQACRPFLERQIEAVAPKIILALGPGALRGLLGADAEGERGEWAEWRQIPVLPTYHPAELMERPALKRLVFGDLKALRARYDALGGRRAG